MKGSFCALLLAVGTFAFNSMLHDIIAQGDQPAVGNTVADSQQMHAHESLAQLLRTGGLRAAMRCRLPKPTRTPLPPPNRHRRHGRQLKPTAQAGSSGAPQAMRSARSISLFTSWLMSLSASREVRSEEACLSAEISEEKAITSLRTAENCWKPSTTWLRPARVVWW